MCRCHVLRLGRRQRNNLLAFRTPRDRAAVDEESIARNRLPIFVHRPICVRIAYQIQPLRTIASQCALPGLSEKRERNETAYVMSGRVPSDAYINEPTASRYGMSRMAAASAVVCGDCALDSVVFGSIGVGERARGAIAFYGESEDPMDLTQIRDSERLSELRLHLVDQGARRRDDSQVIDVYNDHDEVSPLYAKEDGLVNIALYHAEEFLQRTQEFLVPVTSTLAEAIQRSEKSQHHPRLFCEVCPRRHSSHQSGGPQNRDEQRTCLLKTPRTVCLKSTQFLHDRLFPAWPLRPFLRLAYRPWLQSLNIRHLRRHRNASYWLFKLPLKRSFSAAGFFSLIRHLHTGGQFL
ncbi:hypothetical protein SCP_0313300 [Sparassis crispa]|uniref:Uncharacterized protein n=1 Tax=Sparassis crispa TaxID=139825 RepID=A0A401GHK5_9APHY|nr:hypothetical protein SCP_0313300 [Sparassis crispa]GBE81601.1 hypothetical protein SCP_0313300 [Sparassis crispa]